MHVPCCLLQSQGLLDIRVAVCAVWQSCPLFPAAEGKAVLLVVPQSCLQLHCVLPLLSSTAMSGDNAWLLAVNRYPFTACEVFCCEVEAVFNTLLEDEELLQLLFSLLDKDPPLSCKAAGYFGRVVGQLLLRKTNEMMQYLSNNDGILEKLIKHVDTTSIADIIKRLVGADDHSSMIFLPMHTQVRIESQLCC
jgi:hypothetical protein